MPSVRMGLRAINLTKKLVISQPHSKASASAAKPSSWFLNPGCLSRPVSLLTIYLLTILPHGALFFDTTFPLLSFLSSETEQD